MCRYHIFHFSREKRHRPYILVTSENHQHPKLMLWNRSSFIPHPFSPDDLQLDERAFMFQMDGWAPTHQPSPLQELLWWRLPTIKGSGHFFSGGGGADFTDETLVASFSLPFQRCLLKGKAEFFPGFPLENVGFFVPWDLHRIFLNS